MLRMCKCEKKKKIVQIQNIVTVADCDCVIISMYSDYFLNFCSPIGPPIHGVYERILNDILSNNLRIMLSWTTLDDPCVTFTTAMYYFFVKIAAGIGSFRTVTKIGSFCSFQSKLTSGCLG